MKAAPPAPSWVCSSWLPGPPRPDLRMIISSWSGCLWNAWKKPGSSWTSMTTNDSQPVPGGAQRMPALPQSKVVVSTSPAITNLLISPSWLDLLEPSHLLGHRRLGRQPFHAGRAEEADHALGALEHIGGIVRLRDGPAVAEDEDLRVDRLRRVVHRLDQADALVQRLGRLGADRTAGGQPHVRDEHVRACLGHRLCLFGLKDVGGGQEVELVRHADHVHLEPEAHAGLLEPRTIGAVHQADGGE